MSEKQTTVSVVLINKGRKNFKCDPEKVADRIKEILDCGYCVEYPGNEFKVFLPKDIDHFEFGIPS